MTTHVRVRIGHLVLEGTHGDSGAAVARAVEAELARLLAARLPDRLQEPTRLARLTTPAPAGGPAAGGELGRRVGRAVYGALDSGAQR